MHSCAVCHALCAVCCVLSPTQPHTRANMCKIFQAEQQQHDFDDLDAMFAKPSDWRDAAPASSSASNGVEASTDRKGRDPDAVADLDFDGDVEGGNGTLKTNKPPCFFVCGTREGRRILSGWFCFLSQPLCCTSCGAVYACTVSFSGLVEIFVFVFLIVVL